MLYRFILGLMLSILLVPAHGRAEIVTTSADQKALSLTIYNSNLALVRDLRTVDLPAGEHLLAFKEISAEIQPETALLKGGEVEVVEQNYEFDLLSPETLLRKYVGRKITLVRSNEKTGEETKVEAKVLSVVNGIVLQVEDHIETKIDGRVLYPDVPDNLRDKPTLTMLVSTKQKNNPELELSYLTGGMSWRADYIAELNETDDRVDLKGWVTLINNSGIAYSNAKLQLVAGDVHRVEREKGMRVMATDMAEGRGAEFRPPMQRESLFEYHLYSVERPTTILQNQSKQIALLQELNGICRKELLLKSENPRYYWSKIGEIEKGESVGVFLHMENDKASNFGTPKPAGTVRVYKKDKSGFAQFVGEDSINHTPENELIKIRLGRSFDVTADRIQTDFSIVRGPDEHSRIHESAYKITLKNSKDEAVEVTVEEELPGDWTMLEESLPHRKEDAATVSWKVGVGAKGSAVLTYRVRSVLR